MLRLRVLALCAVLSAAEGAADHRRRRRPHADDPCDYEGATQLEVLTFAPKYKQNLFVKGPMTAFVFQEGCNELNINITGQRNVLKDLTVAVSEDTDTHGLYVEQSSTCHAQTPTVMNLCVSATFVDVSAYNRAVVWVQKADSNLFAYDGASIYVDLLTGKTRFDIVAVNGSAISVALTHNTAHLGTKIVAKNESQVYWGFGSTHYPTGIYNVQLVVDDSRVEVLTSCVLTARLSHGYARVAHAQRAYLKGDNKSMVVLDGHETEIIVLCTETPYEYQGNATVVEEPNAWKYQQCRKQEPGPDGPDGPDESAATEAAPAELAV